MNIEDESKGKSYADGISDCMQVIRYYAKHQGTGIDELCDWEKGSIATCENINESLQKYFDKHCNLNKQDKILKEKINKLFYGFMKEARRQDFMEFLEDWELSAADFGEIQKYFAEKNIKLG